MDSKFIIAKLERFAWKGGSGLVIPAILWVLSSGVWPWPSTGFPETYGAASAAARAGGSRSSRRWAGSDAYGSRTQDRAQSGDQAQSGDPAKAQSDAESEWKRGTAESRRRAIDKYNEAISLWNARGDHRRDASILNSIGSIHSELGDTRRALELFQCALAAAEGSGDTAGKADALSSIAYCYDIFGNKIRAAATYERALSIVRAAGDRRREGGILNDA